MKKNFDGATFRTVHAVSSWREPIDLGRLVLGVHFKSWRWALTGAVEPSAIAVCDVCRCASKHILFEQLNINNDVFKRVTVVLCCVISSQNSQPSNICDVGSMAFESMW